MKYTENTLWRTEKGEFIKIKDMNHKLVQEVYTWVKNHPEKYENVLELLTVLCETHRKDT